MTDRQLLERFVARRDESAFTDLVHRHGPMVLGVCRQVLRHAHDAEDAFQSTFLILVRNAETIQKQDSLGSWLYGVAYRIAMRAKVHARRRAYTRQGAEMAVSEPETDLDRDEFRPVLHDEVSRLPAKYRAPIVLCYLEGQTHEQAAQQLEWPVGTVKGRLSRARELLRSRLTRRGLVLPVGLIVVSLSREATVVVPEILVEATVRAAMDVAAGGALAATNLFGDAILLDGIEDELAATVEETDTTAQTIARLRRRRRLWLAASAASLSMLMLFSRVFGEQVWVRRANPPRSHPVARPFPSRSGTVAPPRTIAAPSMLLVPTAGPAPGNTEAVCHPSE